MAEATTMSDLFGESDDEEVVAPAAGEETKTPEPAVAPVDEQKLIVHVERNGVKARVKIWRTTPMQRIFSWYASQVCVPVASLHIEFRGVRIGGLDTADMIGLRDGDRLDAKIVSLGDIKMHLKILEAGNARSTEATAAAGALARLTDNDAANCAAIVDAGGIELLVALVTNGAARGQAQATWTLFHLAADAANKDAIREAGGIAPLVALARSGSAGGKQVAAAAALASLAVHNDANQAAIAAAGGIAPLVALLRRSGAAGGNAAGALTNLACKAANRTAIVEAGAIPPLVALLRSGEEKAAMALTNLACNRDACTAIAEAGAIPPLVALLKNGKAHGQECAARALQNLILKRAWNMVEIVEAGAVDPLVALMRDASGSLKEAATAALKQFNSCALAWALRHRKRRVYPLLLAVGAAIPARSNGEDAYLRKVAAAGGFPAYEKSHRQALDALAAKAFPCLPTDVTAQVVSFAFHVGYY